MYRWTGSSKFVYVCIAYGNPMKAGSVYRFHAGEGSGRRLYQAFLQQLSRGYEVSSCPNGKSLVSLW